MAAVVPYTTGPTSGPVYEFNETVSDGGFSQRRQFAWLKRSKCWRELPASKWQPRKVIGKGAYGLCGVWDYIGENKNTPRQIAVKQTLGVYSKTLRGESKMLHLTTLCNTNHIVKLYKGCHRGQGTGVDENIDPLPYNTSGKYLADMEVVRMYMEYLPNGDVDDLSGRFIVSRTGLYQRSIYGEFWVVLQKFVWYLVCLGRNISFHYFSKHWRVTSHNITLLN